MEHQRVLHIGMDPSVIDFSPWPGQDADKLRARIAAAEADLRSEGLDVNPCLLPDDADAAEELVRALLVDDGFDVVEIGSGVRTSHEYTLIFERVVNTVVAVRPGVPLCFNDSPESTLDAVRRGLRRNPRSTHHASARRAPWPNSGSGHDGGVTNASR